MRNYADMIGRLKNPANAQQGVNSIIEFGNKYKKYGVGPQIATILTNIKEARTKAGDTSSNAAIDKGVAELNAPAN